MDERFTSLQVLDETTLKLIALVSMVIDHVASLFFPEAMWMRVIGRIAMPIFSFCIAEGYIYTRDTKKYLMRLGLFALISEIPYDLAFFRKLDLIDQNILFTFFLAVLSLMIFDWLEERYKGTLGMALGTAAVIAVGVASVFLHANYNFTVVGLVFVFYILADKGPFIRYSGGIGFYALMRNMGIYRWGLLGFVPIMLYNRQRGRGLKLLFYYFYPVHLVILYLLRLILKV